MWLLCFPRFLKQIPNFSLGDFSSSFAEAAKGGMESKNSRAPDGANKFHSSEFPFQAPPARVSSTAVYPRNNFLEHPRTSPFLLISPLLDKTGLYPGNISLEHPRTSPFFPSGAEQVTGTEGGSDPGHSRDPYG